MHIYREGIYIYIDKYIHTYVCMHMEREMYISVDVMCSVVG